MRWIRRLIDRLTGKDPDRVENEEQMSEARTARVEAERDLERARARRVEAEQLEKSFREMRERNNFGGAVRAAFEPRR